MVDLLDGLDVCGHMQSWPRFDWVPAFTEPFPMFQISFWQLHWICIYLITRGALTPLAPIGCRRIASVCGTTKPFFHLLSHGSECYYVDIKRIQKPKTLSLVVVWCECVDMKWPTSMRSLPRQHTADCVLTNGKLIIKYTFSLSGSDSINTIQQ